MCKASKHLNELEKLIRNIDSDEKMLLNKLSSLDSHISEIYHKIECANFNACEGFYLSKQLQESLRKRRIVKTEWGRINSLKQTLNIPTVKKSIPNSKKSIAKNIQKSTEWQQSWKYTYSIDEILH